MAELKCCLKNDKIYKQKRWTAKKYKIYVTSITLCFFISLIIFMMQYNITLGHNIFLKKNYEKMVKIIKLY